MSKEEKRLGFYATPEHACNYINEQKASTLFADPRFPKNKKLHSALTSIGFRRSGEHIYQPHCSDCSACISVRIPVDHFTRNRNQQRNWNRNADLAILQCPAEFSEEHFSLYKKYIHARHAGGGMEAHTADTYMAFLTSEWAETVFYEFRLNDQLLAVAVIDVLELGLSAVYSFFEPNENKRSLGRFAILFEIELCKQMELNYLYLGYWIRECRKMNYKKEYQPLEYFTENQWKTNLKME